VSRTNKVGLELGGGGHTIPGNHDMFLRSVFGTPNRSAVYAEYFDSVFPTHHIWSTPIGYVTLLKLDSNRVSGFNFLNLRNLSFQGEVGSRQLGELQALVARLQTQPPFPDYDYDSSLKVVLIHHHLVDNNGSAKSTSALIDAVEVTDVLSALKVDLVLCGHEHEPYMRKIGSRKSFFFSCAGSACKEDERINSFKVYCVERFDRIFMKEYTASTAGRLYAFTAPPGPGVLLQ